MQDPLSSTSTTADPGPGHARICRVPARVGLLGNPSDGYNGCCISFSLDNFHAEVTLQPSDRLRLIPHPRFDAHEYASMQALSCRVNSCGYYGGVRLLAAMVKVFSDACVKKGLALPDSNFSLSYDTNIPQQAGLSGSSAICCAALNCMLGFYGLGSDRFPMEERPAMVLRAEQELGITAGLQDRVIQVYGGLVFMDFSEAYMKEHGHGKYKHLDASLLSRLPGCCPCVLYDDNPSDSGKVHASVRQRWLDGDEEVRKAMDEVAECARMGRKALEEQDVAQVVDLINRNFDLRRRMFGDEALGARNLMMIELARSVGCAAKFTGSGGAALVLAPGGEAQAAQLEQLATPLGLKLIRAQLGQSYAPEN